jgi:DeoR/GlpR family transcriptional regulator of sugar metabolism
MLKNERLERIKELIAERKSMKISELSKILGVSEMTVHRDIKVLVQQGIVMKTFGGITLVPDKPRNITNGNECVVCHKRIEDRLSYRLILSNNRIESACCVHCGLIRHQQLDGDVIEAICHDFLSGTTISAKLALFVMDSQFELRCCQPQIIPFERKDYAERFVKGFEGTILSFEEALSRICYQKHYAQKGCCQDG